MHALHNIHTALAPDGILVDTQPVSARPPVAADGVILGTLDMREWLDTIQAVDERFAETIGAGLYELPAGCKAARCRVLGRPNRQAIRAPCVLASLAFRAAGPCG